MDQTLWSLILQSLYLCLIVFDEQQDKDYHVDTLTHYRTIVRKIIEEHASYKPSHGHIETEAIIDPVKDHERGSCGTTGLPMASLAISSYSPSGVQPPARCLAGMAG